MFYTEFDVQPAVDGAIYLFGKVGNIDPNGMKNISIATRQFGKIWYGDINMDTPTLIEKLYSLSASIDQKIYVFHNDSYDFNNPLLVT